ncbi:MAG: uracil-DNA glycosylase family protein [Bacteroidales bacterium]|nr:uracil-DNA glycosylase family protein [Bacteroidales bacterium]MDD2426339.1 uracil-DNA glycosylase family protein [Bacteroidales bacterium]MDD3990223.1 uracil-DNA glycosylase family protein [Bacteroidales bacterium]MDD4639512.1 uracil-DNA glycosylase family protein [Bacteroidales bacterium]
MIKEHRPQITAHHPKITESHPLEPFLPTGAKLLMLGSFPPPAEKWSMNFFYPNFQNDMWRIIGMIFYDNPGHFIKERKFDAEKIKAFCKQRGIALYDTACKVIRQQNNASDKYLEVVERTDITALLNRIPECEAIVVTGQKATDTLLETLTCSGLAVSEPSIGEYNRFVFSGKEMLLYRMPSTSRAYPLPIEKKAEIYQKIFAVDSAFSSINA